MLRWKMEQEAINAKRGEREVLRNANYEAMLRSGVDGHGFR